jgi:hypothetical protein
LAYGTINHEEKHNEVCELPPHVINIVSAEGQPVLSLDSSGIARCAEEAQLVEQIDGVCLYDMKYGEVTGLPEEGTMYIVSQLVRQAIPERLDVASPGPLVRNDSGNPVGCKGLVCNSKHLAN